ncbi:MAG: LytTR family DNA-binding domain-containing protein [Opitutales bacterium]|nr:LytTR family DNA-binding domain-containing protein [Opitutales bacterium]
METTKSIRTLVVDDEPLAREGIKILLKDFECIEVIGECSNGEDALAAIQEQDIDLVFLDIQMPSMTGMEVVAELHKDTPLPYIVFVTAYDEYAVKAFEVHAVDYLLKPIDREMVNRGIKRVIELITEQQSQFEIETLQNLIESIIHKKDPSHKKIPIKADGKILFLDTAEIPLIEANGDYINVYHRDKSYLVHDRLKRMEKELEPFGFLRIHRSFLINTTCVKSIENDAFGEFMFSFENCSKKARSSRGYSKSVHQFLEKY